MMFVLYLFEHFITRKIKFFFCCLISFLYTGNIFPFIDPPMCHSLVHCDQSDISPISYKQIIIHVGIHKTGTTSIQTFLGRHRFALQRLGIDFYTGIFIADNHVELHDAAMRLNRDSPFKLDSKLHVDKEFIERVHHHISQYIKQSDFPIILFSAEGLSLLYYEDELRRLKNFFSKDCIKILIYVRNPTDFLRSYKNELNKHAKPEKIEKDSFAYTEPDSWLLDFESRISKFEKVFGPENVILIDYDDEVGRDGNIIPSFLRAIGIESDFNKEDWDSIYLNEFKATGL